MIKTIDKIKRPQFKKAWSVIEDCLSVQTERDHERAMKILDKLLVQVGDNEKHPLYGYLDTLGNMIELYEQEHYPMSESSPQDVLNSLMEEHSLKQSDFPEVGSQGVVSEILNGKRQLTVRQIKALAKRFHVSPATFID